MILQSDAAVTLYKAGSLASVKDSYSIDDFNAKVKVDFKVS